MIFIRGRIKNNKNALKGFTLIEVLLVAALIGIATSTYMIMAFKYSKTFREEMNLAKEKFNVNQAFIIIEKSVNNADEIKVENNAIGLKRHDTGLKRHKTQCWDYIRKNKNSNVVVDYDEKVSHNANNVIKNVKDFNVYGKQGVVYVCIRMNSGQFYTRCLNLLGKRSLQDL